jgi:hypothetical protein
MFRGYRFLITATCGLALFVALGTGAYFGSLYAPNHKQYEAITGKQAGQNGYQGPSESLPDISGLPGPVERAIANPHPNTGQDHEKRDLAAQEASALWAFWMVVASFLSVFITTVGTIFLYKQIVLTREAVEDTGEATKAMREANQIAKIASENGLRPWLKVALANAPKIIIVNRLPQTKIEIYIENIGQSPAVEIKANAWFCVGYEPHIGYEIAYSHYRKEFLTCLGDLFPGGRSENTFNLVHDGEPVDIAQAFLVIAVFYKTIFSDELRETSVFYRITDSRMEGFEVDFSAPISANNLVFSPWEESPGIIL